MLGEEGMTEVINVQTGEVEVVGGSFILKSTAIGSCLVITAYDPKNKVGALAHIMLPGKAHRKTEEKTRYAADAINEMISRLTDAGTKRDDIEICLVGAGNVLKKVNDNICQANIDSVIQILRQKRLAIKGAVLGGVERKGVALELESGSVFYTEGDLEEKLLWKSTG